MDLINYHEITKANIYVREELAGTLEKISESEYILRYRDEYIKDRSKPSISHTLPKEMKEFKSTKLHPFFDNLITEGWLLKYTEKYLHIDKKNRFALLIATGGETIGAVRVKPLSQEGKEIDLIAHYKGQTQDDLKKYSLESVSIPGFCPYCMGKFENDQKEHKACVREMWGTTRNLNVMLDEHNPFATFASLIYGGSISGAQRKGMFNLDTSKGILQSTAKNSEYILKPDGDYPELPENEHITMAIARRVGFKTPPFVLLKLEDKGHIFAIKRFDRAKIEGKMIKYLQEDMGQITQTPSSDKYESSCEKVAKSILQVSSTAVVDLAEFFERLIFCFITANADMHLKNWSMLELPTMKNLFGLSPIYDFLNTRLAIPKETIDIGLPIKGKSRNLQLSYFKSFAKDAGIEERIMNYILEKARSWKAVADELIPHSLLKEESKSRYLELLEERNKILFG